MDSQRLRFAKLGSISPWREPMSWAMKSPWATSEKNEQHLVCFVIKKTKVWNCWRNMLDKIGQHFVLFLVHKMSQIKLPQRYLKLGSVSPHVEAKVRRTKLCQKGFWTKLGSILSCFLSTTCHKSYPQHVTNQIGPKFFLRKLGSIFPDVEAKAQRAKLSQKVFGQNWAAFCPVLIHTMSQIKSPQRFFWENSANVENQIISKGFGQNWAAFVSCF